ncbi:unnamed protein product [Spirodela intermedia]|uniref:Uncharacterized protein n=1 Tax=Spirodela intermedia TaxID=51605 RepID=A0A7I8JBB1_SPIIN|nr:unnamed protein product [Spirodela intermedia]CAA6667379.1 unnamed protein product [Spirodela intermedia]
MGCAQSKVDGEEAVTRCKERKMFMKEAVAARNAFASAHSAYAVALRNTGSALSDYGEMEAQDVLCLASSAAEVASSSSSSSMPPGKPAIDDTLPPPPPPPPEFSRRTAADQPFPADASIREEDGHELEDEDRRDLGVPQSSTPAPLAPQSQSSRTAVPLAESSPSSWDYFFGTDDSVHRPPLPPDTEEIRPEKDDQGQGVDKHKRAASASAAVGADAVGAGDAPPPSVNPEKMMTEPPLPSKQVRRQKGVADPKRSKMAAATTPTVSFLQILNSLDDHFLKAHDSAQNVSNMLEAKRLHYHSNFADNRGHINHSARVMRAITWNRSFKGLGGDEGGDDFDMDSWETHATILDKLLAWEKKLCDEVKASERMKLEYQRKVAKLNKQKKHGASSEALAATKAEVSHLHTRYIVDMQSMDSTVSEIQRLRDVQLYEKLTMLVRGMAEMWEAMFHQHQSQEQLVQDIRGVDVSNAVKETTEQLRGRTSQLCEVANRWSKHFEDLISNKKKYVKALNDWLRLNLIPIESSLTEKVSSPTSTPRPPIQMFLYAWNDQLAKIPDERAKTAISSFSEVVTAILVQQDEELKQKDKCEDLRKDFIKKKQAFEDWHQSYITKRQQQQQQPRPVVAADAEEEMDPERAEDAPYREVAERQLPVDTAKKKLEDELETHRMLCKQAREKSVHSLKIHLPELFRAMTDFSRSCAHMYKALSAMSPPPPSPPPQQQVPAS